MSNKGRIIWIDIMRGILMISIVMGHIYTREHPKVCVNLQTDVR